MDNIELILRNLAMERELERTGREFVARGIAEDNEALVRLGVRIRDDPGRTSPEEIKEAINERRA